MKWIAGLTTLLFVANCSLNSDRNPVETYAKRITSERLKEHLTILAADDMQGRMTGTAGEKKAAAFIAGFFEKSGLSKPVNDSYFQAFELYAPAVDSAYVKAGSLRYDNYTEIAYYGSFDSKGEVTLDIVFAGKGKEEDYKRLDVKGKAVCVLSRLPSGQVTALTSALTETAKAHGAVIVFIFPDNQAEYTDAASRIRTYAQSSPLSLKKPAGDDHKGVFVISPSVAGSLFHTGADQLIQSANNRQKKMPGKFRTGRISYRSMVTVHPVQTKNVLAYLEGTDKKDELVVITAHYDHIGQTAPGPDHINNGADDDGSGTVAVMEIAKNFATAKEDGHGPRRSLLFMAVSGEEEGLLGSEYYTEHPVYPLANTVVDLNIDMIGRNDSGHQDSARYVYVIGSDKLSSELHQLSEKTNATYTHLKFDYTYNDINHPSNLYKRSDHWNFAKHGIPIIFYFDGVHEDYHKPSDEVSRIDFDALSTRARCVFFTAWEIANREGRVGVDTVGNR